MFNVDCIDNIFVVYYGVENPKFTNPYNLLNHIISNAYSLNIKKPQFIIIDYDDIYGTYLSSLKDFKIWVEWVYKHLDKCGFCYAILPQNRCEFCSDACKINNGKLQSNKQEESEFFI
jgi:hypothetical protein